MRHRRLNLIHLPQILANVTSLVESLRPLPWPCYAHAPGCATQSLSDIGLSQPSPDLLAPYPNTHHAQEGGGAAARGRSALRRVSGVDGSRAGKAAVISSASVCRSVGVTYNSDSFSRSLCILRWEMSTRWSVHVRSNKTIRDLLFVWSRRRALSHSSRRPREPRCRLVAKRSRR